MGIQETCEYNGVRVCDGISLRTCDDLQTEFETLKDNYDILYASVQTYDSCEAYSETAITSATQASADLEALIIKLEEDSRQEWQRTWNDFRENGFGCSYVPSQYCLLITDLDGSVPCKLDGQNWCVDA